MKFNSRRSADTYSDVQIQEGEILKDVTHLQENALRKHQEVLELIEALSDTESSDRASSVRLRGLPPW